MRWMLPPGRNTRRASASATRGSLKCSTTHASRTRSKCPSGQGRAVASPTTSSMSLRPCSPGCSSRLAAIKASSRLAWSISRCCSRALVPWMCVFASIEPIAKVQLGKHNRRGNQRGPALSGGAGRPRAWLSHRAPRRALCGRGHD